jgi:hypothetical protein
LQVLGIRDGGISRHTSAGFEGDLNEGCSIIDDRVIFRCAERPCDEFPDYCPSFSMLILRVEAMEVPGSQIIAANDEVRFGRRDGGGEGSEWRQTAIAENSVACAGLADRVPRRADGLHGASGLRESNRKSSSREPARSGGKQNGGLQPASNLS